MGVSAGPDLKEDGLVLALDGANLKSYSQNVFPYPLDGYSWGTSGNQMTVSRDTSTSSPVGNSPLKLVTSGTSAYTNTYNSLPFTLSPAAQGQTWTFSFWVKGSSSFSASMLIFESNSSGNYTAYGQPYYSVTTEWTRVSGSYTMTQATTAGVQVRIDCYVNGVTLWVDGFQLEKASSASSFNSISNTNGTTWRDLIGNGNTGTLTNGPTFNSSNGGCLTFDGTNDYISTPITGTFSQITFDFWGFFDDPSLNMLSREESAFGDWTSNRVHFGTRWTGSNAGMHFNVNGIWQTTPTTNLRSGWNHYVLVYDTVANLKIVYLNGILSSSNVTNGNMVLGDFRIGVATNLNAYYRGNISNFKIYNRALTAAEIQQNYNALRNRFGL